MNSTHELTTATERAMVGAFLADGARELSHVRADVMSEEIGDAVARATFDAACKAADDGADVSPVTVAARLESMGAQPSPVKIGRAHV